MKKLGAAVIGLKMGRGHLEGYRRNPNIEIKAVCDLDERLLKILGDKYGVDRRITDYREILNMDDVDVVSVATPDHLHCEQSIALMRSGKHILCEKPMALKVDECKKMLDVSKETGVKFMIGQVCRYAPGFVLTKKLIDQGVIGDLFYVESEYAHDYLGTDGVGGWRKDPAIKREPFIGGGCHAVDLVRWIAGEVHEVFAYSNHMMLKDWPVDDCFISSMRFKSGVIGKVFVSIGCKRPYTMRSVFYGSEGTIISDNTSPSIQVYSNKLQDKLSFSSIPVAIDNHNVSAEVAELVNCILQDKPVKTDAVEGMMTVAVCTAAVDSSKKGTPIIVEDILSSVGYRK